MTFSSVEQRMANYYLDTLPPFIPSDIGNEKSERVFYDLIFSLYHLASGEPELFVRELHEDDAYPNRFNKTAYGKPELLKSMKKFTGEMDTLLTCMLQMGSGHGGVNLSKRQKNILSRLGIRENGPLPDAWTALAARPEVNLITFSRCMFSEDYPYPNEVFARLLGAEAYERLTQWLVSHGYTYSGCAGGRMSAEYANLRGGSELPRSGFLYKVGHTGISTEYDPYVKDPQVLGLRIPGGMKSYLEAFDQADERLQSFILRQTKKCDGCGYCVQTDKTGKRRRAYVEVRHGQKDYQLCPYFPGCSYCHTSLCGELVEDITAMFSFMDKLFR